MNFYCFLCLRVYFKNFDISFYVLKQINVFRNIFVRYANSSV